MGISCQCQIRYKGSSLNPLSLRVAGLTSPSEKNLGCLNYYKNRIENTRVVLTVIQKWVARNEQSLLFNLFEAFD